jgi:hypothetical protein
MLQAVAIQCPHTSGFPSATGGSTRNGSQAQRLQTVRAALIASAFLTLAQGCITCFYNPQNKFRKYDNKVCVVHSKINQENDLT